LATGIDKLVKFRELMLWLVLEVTIFSELSWLDDIEGDMLELVLLLGNAWAASSLFRLAASRERSSSLAGIACGLIE
jgi:hypothetical protein